MFISKFATIYRGDILGIFTRCQSTTARLAEKASSAESGATPGPANGNIRRFEEIPEAKGLPLIGTLLDYTPLRGFKPEKIYELWARRHEKYGDIYKEKSPTSIDESWTVACRSREDTETMFHLEGRTPIRPPVTAFTDLKKAIGLPETMVNLNGKDWYRHRIAINEPLLLNKMVWKYVKDQHEVAKDLVRYLRRNMGNNGEVEDFQTVLDRWAFELSGTFLLNERLGLLEDNPEPVLMGMFDGVAKMLKFIIESPYNRNYSTTSKEMIETKAALQRSYEVMSDILERHKELDDTTLGKMLHAKNLSDEERISLVFDVFGASVETTSKASALMIYCLTANPDAQEKLRDEVTALADDKPLTGRTIDGMKYMNGFIKEANRLYPLTHLHYRTYQKSIVLSGYDIPAGTPVLNTSNSTQNRNPDYYPEPDKFLPERWMGKEESKGRKLTGPFGMGPRACPGRRFAMQEIRLLLIELLKNFRVEYHYKPIVSHFRGSGFPSEDPRFTFIPLKTE